MAAMPTTCERCYHYSTADTPGACPDCGEPLRFTLLPPPDFTDPADAPPDPPRRRADAHPPPRRTLVGWLADSPLVVVGLVVLYVLFLAYVWVVVARAVGDPAFAPAAH